MFNRVGNTGVKEIKWCKPTTGSLGAILTYGQPSRHSIHKSSQIITQDGTMINSDHAELLGI